jgi:large subunit ribosomal protein L4
MAAPKAPMLDATGKKAKDVTLPASVFAADVKPHVLHETVRAEAAAARAGTRATKSRGLVSGGRSKPWRQKGTGRARAGTTRAPQWTGGGTAFAIQPRSFSLKVNRKTRKSALRGALTLHAQRGTFGVVDASAFTEPSTKTAAQFAASWGVELPLVVVAEAEEEGLGKSFRNLADVVVVDPRELEVGTLVWARSVLASEKALNRVQEVAAP